MALLQLRKSISLVITHIKKALTRYHLGGGHGVRMTDREDTPRRGTHDDYEFEEQMRCAREGMKSYRNTLHQLSK